MRIRVVTPIVSKDFGKEAIADLIAAARPGTIVDNVFLERGPASVESPYDHYLSVPETLARVAEAEREGYHGVLINCMGDPGLEPARTLVRIPVVGPFQAGVHLAANLGKRIAVVGIGKQGRRPGPDRRAEEYGMRNVVSSRGTGIAVLDLEKDRDAMVAALVEQGSLAVAEDGADVIVFGCTGMAGVAAEVQAGLREKGIDVPVVDPAIAALKTLEVLVDMQLSHSALGYPPPPKKVVQGYDYLLEARGLTVRQS